MYLINATGLLCPDIFFNSSAGKPDKKLSPKTEEHYSMISFEIMPINLYLAIV